MGLSKHIGWIVPLAAIALTAPFALNCAGPRGTSSTKSPAEPGLPSPSYVRLKVSQNDFVYVEIQGNEVRVASSFEGLKIASPVRMPDFRGENVLQSPMVTLPIPADQLPQGFTAVKANFEKPWAESWTVPLQIGLCRTDEQNREWCYVYGRAISPVGNSPQTAPYFELPVPEKMSIEVKGKPTPGTVGIWVHLLGGMGDVMMDGRSVQAQVRVLDASGEEVASKKGQLSDFGFS